MARWPGMNRNILDYQPTNRALKAGDVIQTTDAAYHIIEYVNSSGAYAVPLAAVNKEIAGNTVAFTQGGRTISTNSAVQIINPLQMGGNSQEYRRYVRIIARLRKGQGASDVEVNGMALPTSGVLLGDFDTTNNVDDDGRVIDVVNTTPGMDDMAKSKKSAKKSNGAKREKVAKKVRKCACGCQGETTSYFVPGHDARMHGWIKKLADGRILKNGKDAKSGEQTIPAVTLRSLDLVETKEGARAKSPHFYKDAD